MFKVEAYITSIILSNADKYIKGFRKQDAQVSIWEGDATFSNIDLNVDALNNEFQLPFIFTSGYIHQLNIHVPWTKINSEPVVVNINTIECVVKLKTTRDPKPDEDNEKHCTPSESKLPRSTSNDETDVKPPPSSYTATLTRRIMNNISISCKNIIFKLVEEDVVLSMNIEKMLFNNVNDVWVPAFTEINTERAITRKLMQLSGVTLCLDKRNLCGRIDTYLEPLLYRCAIDIRISREYRLATSSNPFLTIIHLHSRNMSFIISEPQLPMLQRIVNLLSSSEEKIISRDSNSNTSLSQTNVEGDPETYDASNIESWGYWIWNMLPSLSYQEDDDLTESKLPEFQKITHLGLYVEKLDITIKVAISTNDKVHSKTEYKSILEARLSGFICECATKGVEWFNVQTGICSIEITPTSYCPCGLTQDNSTVLFFKSGSTKTEFTDGSLFNEVAKETEKEGLEKEKVPKNMDTLGLYNKILAQTTIEDHVFNFSENFFLSRTPAFAVDYLRIHPLLLNEERINIDVEEEQLNPQKDAKEEKKVLIRYVVGKTDLNITSGIIHCLRAMRKIFKPVKNEIKITTDYSTNAFVDENSNHVTQFTFFDLNINFLLDLHWQLLNSPKYFQVETCEKFSCAVEEMVGSSISISFKCLDGRYIKSLFHTNYSSCNTNLLINAVGVNVKVKRQDNYIIDVAQIKSFKYQHVNNVTQLSPKFSLLLDTFAYKSSCPYVIFCYHVMNSVLEIKPTYASTCVLCNSSLKTDLKNIKDNVVFELNISDLKLEYYFRDNFTAGLGYVNGLKAYIVNENGSKCNVLSTSDLKPAIQVSWQNIKKNRNDDGSSLYPRFISVNINDWKIMILHSLYDILMYDPVISYPNPPQVMSRSKPRSIVKKVSVSSSSQTKKTHTYPKESVHTPSDQGTKISIVDVTSCIVEQPAKLDQTFSGRLVRLYNQFKDLLVNFEISGLVINIPNNGDLLLFCNDHNNCDSNDMDIMINEAITHNVINNVFVFYVNYIKLKCDVNADELTSEIPFQFLTQTRFYEKQYFPWTLTVKEFYCDTLHKNMERLCLLKSFNAACTVGVSKIQSENTKCLLSFCVHVDLHPLQIMLNQEQIVMMDTLIKTLDLYLKKDVESLESDNDQKNDEKTVSGETAVSGWFQCTVPKLTFVLRDNSNDELQFFKLISEIEDSIFSLEFDSIYHKVKLKIASMKMSHYIRNSKQKIWKHGPFGGIILQRRLIEITSSGIDATKSTESSDHFLQITITRASSNNLHSRISSKLDTSTPTDNVQYVCEIIFQLCPIDVVLIPSVLETFMKILHPINSQSQKRTINYHNTMPLIYFNSQNMRLFLPQIRNTIDKQDEACHDTLIVQVSNVHIDCMPDNPISRKLIRPDIYEEAISKNILRIPGSIIEDRQYFFKFNDVLVNSGIWNDVKNMLKQEQLFASELSGTVQQNPALMWNQLLNTKQRSDVNLQNLVQPFMIEMIVAPAIVCRHTAVVVCGNACEVYLTPEIKVQGIVQQIILLHSLTNEWIKLYSHSPYFTKRKIIIGSEVKEKECFTHHSGNDSGLESMEHSSVGSSIPKKPIGNIQAEVLQASVEKIMNVDNVNYCKKITARERITTDLFITCPSMGIELHKDMKKGEISETSSSSTSHTLLQFQINDPHLSLTSVNDSVSIELSAYRMVVSAPIPVLLHSTSLLNTDKLMTIFEAKSDKKTTFSEIPFNFVNINILINSCYIRKIEIQVQQSLHAVLHTQVVDYLLSMTNYIKEEYNKFTNKMIEKRENGYSFIDYLRLLLKRGLNIVINTAPISITLSANSKKEKQLCVGVKSIECNIDHMTSSVMNESIQMNGACDSITISILNNTDKTHNAAKMLNTLLNPWSFQFNLKLHWTFDSNQCKKYCKIISDNLVIEINPSYGDYLKDLIGCYRLIVAKYFTKYDKIGSDAGIEDQNQIYQDDLRVGAFRYIMNNKCNDNLPSPYEIILCNSRRNKYMCWMYPQPRALIMLRTYPVLLHESDDEDVLLLCELQFYDEMKNVFCYYARFALSQNVVQNIALPAKRPHMVLAKCWRIVVSYHGGHIIDVKSLAGCIRVDSTHNDSSLPDRRIYVEISSIQINFSSILDESEYKVSFEEYTIDRIPSIHCFLSLIIDRVEMNSNFYKEEYTVDLRGSMRTDVLNYEYVMMQPFLEPCIIQALILKTKENDTATWISTGPALCHITPTLFHTIFVSRNILNKEKMLPAYEITAPFIICNNTNVTIMFGQEETQEKISLKSLHCHLYAWATPYATRKLIFKIPCGKMLTSEPVDIKMLGSQWITCSTMEDSKAQCILIITVIKHSSIVHQINISGCIKVENCTYSKLEVLLISNNNEENNVEDAGGVSKNKFVTAVECGKTAISIMSLTSHNPSFKIRYINKETKENGIWSGAIPIVKQTRIAPQFWFVKVPLIGRKDQFHCISCEVSHEDSTKNCQTRVVFRSLCAVRSNLPENSNLRVTNIEDNSPMFHNVIGRGILQPLNLPNVLNLDKSTFSWCQNMTDLECLQLKFPVSTLESAMDDMRECDVWPYVFKDKGEIDWNITKCEQNYPIVKVKRLENACSRILIEISPWCLMVNIIGCRISVDISGNSFTIQHYGVLAPPTITNTFTLFITEETKCYESHSFYLQTDNNSTHGHSELVAENEIISTYIDCDKYVIYATITCKLINDIKMITLLPSYVINNNSSRDFNIIGLIVCTSSITKCYDIPKNLQEFSTSIAASNSSTNSMGKPIYKWMKIGSGSELNMFIIIEIDGMCSGPVKLSNLNLERSLQLLFSTNNNNNLSYNSLNITSHKKDGQVFITVFDNMIPDITIKNNSQLNLNIASANEIQKRKDSRRNDTCWNWNLYVNHDCEVDYSFQNATENCSNKNNDRLVFSNPGNNNWSVPIQITPVNNHVVLIPGSEKHIKLNIIKEGFTKFLLISTPTPHELSSAFMKTHIIPSTSKIVTDNNNTDESDTPVSFGSSKCSSKLKDNTKICIRMESITIRAHKEDDKENYVGRTAIISLNMDDLMFMFKLNKHKIEEEMVCNSGIGRYQVDNEENYERTFDFPVVLLSNTSWEKSTFPFSYYELDEILEEKLALKITFIVNLTKSHLQDINIELEKLNAYIEDKYIAKLKDTILHMLATNSKYVKRKLSVKPKKVQSKRECAKLIDNKNAYVSIPDEVLELFHCVCNPVRLRTLYISSIDASVSIHSSTAFYLAVHDSPIHFSQFRCNNISTSQYQLGRTLIIHYVVDAVYGSGWAIGSLEFVGSPGSLARAVGAGIKDFLSLPISGIADGPQGFILGVAHGSASLMKHLVGGTLSSVTKFAGSWARTLDRLTLDEDDLVLSEVVHRTLPSSVTEGVLQGLAEFGISLLGGISGIAHHPLQYALSNDTSQKRSFINSISLGVVGVITRPLSGAAQLVANTGQGILSRIGWNTLPRMRHECNTSEEIILLESVLKRKWKLNKSKDENVLLVIEGTLADNSMLPVTLTVTNKYFYVQNMLTDKLINKIDLTLHKFEKSRDDPSLVIVSTIENTFMSAEKFTHVRITKFINEVNESYKLVKIQESFKCEKIISFYVNPQGKEFLLTMINYVK